MRWLKPTCDIWLLGEEASLEEITAVAIKRLVAWQIAQEMKTPHLTKTALAEKMHTSWAALNRFPDETDTTLGYLEPRVGPATTTRWIHPGPQMNEVLTNNNVPPTRPSVGRV